MTKPIRVLLVEDNPDYTNLMQEMLSEVKATQVDVECTNQLSKAVERLAIREFDFVLLDLCLPDSQGFSTVTTLHEQVPDIPIVVHTALPDEQLAIKAMQEEYVKFYLTKPIDSYQLNTVINFFL